MNRRQRKQIEKINHLDRERQIEDQAKNSFWAQQQAFKKDMLSKIQKAKIREQIGNSVSDFLADKLARDRIEGRI